MMRILTFLLFLLVVYGFLSLTFFLSLSFTPFILDIVTPLNESRPVLLPYPGYYFVDAREYFLQIFAHSFVAWQIVIVGIISHDCMFVSYVEHICGILAVIG